MTSTNRSGPSGLSGAVVFRARVLQRSASMLLVACIVAGASASCEAPPSGPAAGVHDPGVREGPAGAGGPLPGLTADELKAISAHNFYSNKPVVVGGESELAAPEALLLRAFAESGWRKPMGRVTRSHTSHSSRLT